MSDSSSSFSSSSSSSSLSSSTLSSLFSSSLSSLSSSSSLFSSSASSSSIPSSLPTSSADVWLNELEKVHSAKTLREPIGNLEDKWKLLPTFLKAKGLVRQHIESYNYFIEQEMKQIMEANCKVQSEAHPDFWLKYTNIKVQMPCVEEGMEVSSVTPNACRLRDISYAAPITVDVLYTKGKQLIPFRL